MRCQESKIRKELELLFFKPTDVSIDDRDKFEEKEMMKKRTFAKKNLYDWFINYIRELIKKR